MTADGSAGQTETLVPQRDKTYLNVMWEMPLKKKSGTGRVKLTVLRDRMVEEELFTPQQCTVPA